MLLLSIVAVAVAVAVFLVLARLIFAVAAATAAVVLTCVGLRTWLRLDMNHRNSRTSRR